MSLSFYCMDLPGGNLATFRTNKQCNGTETSLIECGGVHRVDGICYCGAVAEIMCQPAGKGLHVTSNSNFIMDYE